MKTVGLYFEQFWLQFVRPVPMFTVKWLLNDWFTHTSVSWNSSFADIDSVHTLSNITSHQLHHQKHLQTRQIKKTCRQMDPSQLLSKVPETPPSSAPAASVKQNREVGQK